MGDTRGVNIGFIEVTSAAIPQSSIPLKRLGVEVVQCFDSDSTHSNFMARFGVNKSSKHGIATISSLLWFENWPFCEAQEVSSFPKRRR